MSGSLVHVCFESQSPSSDYVNTQFHCCITTWKVLNEIHHLQDHLKVASFLCFKKKEEIKFLLIDISVSSNFIPGTSYEKVKLFNILNVTDPNSSRFLHVNELYSFPDKA